MSDLFECKICAKRFGTWRGVKEHEYRHRVEKQPCPVCGTNFMWAYPVHLRRHMPVHNYNCDVCGRNFSRRRNMKKHRCVQAGTDNKDEGMPRQKNPSIAEVSHSPGESPAIDDDVTAVAIATKPDDAPAEVVKSQSPFVTSRKHVNSRSVVLRRDSVRMRRCIMRMRGCKIRAPRWRCADCRKDLTAKRYLQNHLNFSRVHNVAATRLDEGMGKQSVEYPFIPEGSSSLGARRAANHSQVQGKSPSPCAAIDAKTAAQYAACHVQIVRLDAALVASLSA